MQRYRDVVLNIRGEPVPGVSVLVKTFPGGVNASLFDDDSGTTLANPLTTDSNGAFSFKAANGHYSVSFSGTGITAQTVSDITLCDPDDVITDALADLAEATGAAAVGFAPAGSIAATTVQAALVELDTEKASLAALAASAGSSLVGFIQAGTGAVAHSVQDELRQRVSVFQFMTAAEIADVQSGAPTLDHTAAIQASITAKAPYGGELLFPAGTYKITAPLTWYNTTSADKPGLAFVGEGRDATIIKSYIASGPVFDVRGTKSFASGGTGSRFFNGGGIYRLKIDGANATGTSDAINVQGWQYAEVVGCYITTFPRDGIRQWVDTGYPNADYSSSSINVIDTWLWDCVGQGVNQTGSIGAWSWEFTKTLFGYCGMGATITSAGNSFFDCSFTGSGFSPSGVVRAGGSHLQIGAAAGGTNRITISGCEFDFARLAHVKLDYLNTVKIERTRFIFNDRNGTGTLTPSEGGVVIAPDSAGSNVQNLRIENSIIRCDGPGICNAFVIANFGNVQGIQVDGTMFANGGGATINKYTGFTDASHFNYRNDYSVTERGTSPTYVVGRPLPQYIGTASSPTVPAGAIIIFGTQETINAQVFGATLYDATGQFTCPVSGYYEVDFRLAVDAATSAEYYQPRLRKNNIVEVEFPFSGNDKTRTIMSARHRIHCTLGDKLDMFSAGASGKNIRPDYSQLVIKLVDR